MCYDGRSSWTPTRRRTSPVLRGAALPRDEYRPRTGDQRLIDRSAAPGRVAHLPWIPTGTGGSVDGSSCQGESAHRCAERRFAQVAADRQGRSKAFWGPLPPSRNRRDEAPGQGLTASTVVVDLLEDIELQPQPPVTVRPGGGVAGRGVHPWMTWGVIPGCIGGCCLWVDVVDARWR